MYSKSFECVCRQTNIQFDPVDCLHFTWNNPIHGVHSTPLCLSTHHHNYRVILAYTRIPIIIIIFAVLLCTAPLNHKQTSPTQKQSLKLIIWIDHNLHLCALQLIPRLMDHSGRLPTPLYLSSCTALMTTNDPSRCQLKLSSLVYVVGKDKCTAGSQ